MTATISASNKVDISASEWKMTGSINFSKSSTQFLKRTLGGQVINDTNIVDTRSKRDERDQHDFEATVSPQKNTGQEDYQHH